MCHLTEAPSGFDRLAVCSSLPGAPEWRGPPWEPRVVLLPDADPSSGMNALSGVILSSPKCGHRSAAVSPLHEAPPTCHLLAHAPAFVGIPAVWLARPPPSGEKLQPLCHSFRNYQKNTGLVPWQKCPLSLWSSSGCAIQLWVVLVPCRTS